MFRLLCLISVAALLAQGCSERREHALKDELCPSSIEELVSLSADELERVDVGRMNLICAEAAAGCCES